MKKILALSLLVVVASLAYTAPLPRTKEKKKEDPAKFLLGQWDMMWSGLQGTVYFHDNNVITGYWPDLHNKYWQGTYEYKGGILSIKESSFDENGNLTMPLSCTWKVKFTKKGNSYTGNMNTKDEEFDGAVVTINRIGKKI